MDDFSKIKEYWEDRLQKIPSKYIAYFGLHPNTITFLTTVGLPNDLNDLVIEIHFYFDNRITKKEFKEIQYIIIGNDSGTEIAISSDNNHVYAVNFGKVKGIESVCFINSSIQQFVESIQSFKEFQNKSASHQLTESALIKLMKEEFITIDKLALSHDSTWWSQIINDPING